MLRRIALSLFVVTALAMTGLMTNGSALAQVGPAVGDPWSASGTVERVDDFGFWLAPDDGGDAIYVELGPPAFWQTPGVTLTAGQTVDVDGYVQGTLYHAAVVTTADGSQIVVRDETGFPLWAGGRNAGANGLRDGSRVPQPQVQVDRDEWQMVEGTVSEVLASALTVELADGRMLTVGLGRPIAAAAADVPFEEGDAVRVSGFDLDGRFVAGEIENLTQGGTLVLRDDYGRPIWAGGPDNGAQMRSGARGWRGAQGCPCPGVQTRPETGRGRAPGGRGGW